ncbi:uncharacterized protein LOC105687509 [Athalia rosae]|uniref:uncharacterized protein LOC105687509 n=1 Tax=Athalia rosae TaxID=37344 RepID=UPI002033951D|nr:uncharacterized protein LOC105687509 [Athalia rosae]
MIKEVSNADIIHPKYHIGPHDVVTVITNPRGPASMRKYHRAALIIVALVSVVSLLFYRHEYNKLRYVLEVLNFFGKPGIKDINSNYHGVENFGSGKLDLRLGSPLPSWQRLKDDLFAYSAHHVRDTEIRVIAFGRTNHDLKLNCEVFFENRQPIKGNYRYLKIGKSSKLIDSENFVYIGYQLFCEYSDNHTPEGVSFFSAEQNTHNGSSIMNVKISPKSLATNELVVCVAPPLNKALSRVDMISFLNFHHMIGINHFVVYDNGIPSTFTEAVEDIVISRRLNLTFTIIPWNFPFSGFNQEFVKEIAEIDCLYRTYNKGEYSVTLYWEEYIILKLHHTLSELLTDFEKSEPSERYQVETSVFCTQQNNDMTIIETAPIAIRNTRKAALSSDASRQIYINKPHKCLNLNSVKSRKASTDLVTINLYRYCSELENKLGNTHDNSISRFAQEMIHAPIYLQFINRQTLLNE